MSVIPTSPPTPPNGTRATRSHAVQFYEGEAHLASAVAAFLAEGLRNGAPALVIATDAHRTLFVERLAAQAIDVETMLHSGQLVLLDSHQTMATFMSDGVPLERRFRETVGARLSKARERFPKAELRAYGEMVELLWREGKREAALELERMWNRLAAEQPFSLLCAYSIGGFPVSEDASAFEEVCELHTHVRPHEPFGDGRDGPIRALSLARLQQRSRALEHEVMERQRAELALHKARGELAQSSRRLTEALQAKDEMLSLLGHELRNPMAPILTAIELLQLKGRQSPEHAIIERHVKMLHGLVSDLLDLGRLSKSKPPMTPRPVGLTPSPFFAQGQESKRAAPRRRVLVVDDNEDAAALLGELLEAFGQQTAVAHRGDQALELARQFEPEVALLDLGLPMMDGFELGRQLKAEHGRVRLVAVSGYSDNSTRTEAVDAGFEAHFVKPVHIADVLKLLSQ
jgi:CheY-like chemotaxis protein